MIRHWLIIAWRTVLGDPVFAAISILSLAIGCAGALLAGAYLREELTWDRWVPASERMVRLDTTMTFPGRPPGQATGAPSGLAPLLADAAPGVEAVTRSMQNQLRGARVGENAQDLFGVFADGNFFEVIEVDFLEGDPSTALADPSGIVLSEGLRETLFGEESALGRTISIGDTGEAVVTGVMAKLPRNTTLSLNFVAPLASPFRDRQFFDDPDTFFQNPNTTIYLRAESVSAARAWRDTLAPLAQDILSQHRADPGDGVSLTLATVPFREMRFAAASTVFNAGNDLPRLRLMLLVAGALLFVSAFNYVSLSLARVVRRTREVGLRKAVGADRGHLMRQHIAEAATFTAIAVVLGFALSELVRPWIAQAMALRMDAAALHHPVFLGAAVAGGAVLAVLVAAYPAVFLAGVKPATILQGRSGSTRALAGAIFALVALQFAAATALVTAVAVFHAQARFLASAPLGYESEDRVFAAIGGVQISGGRVTPEQAERNLARLSRLRAALADEPSVISLSGVSVPPLLNLPPQVVDRSMVPIAPPGLPPEDGVRAYPIWVDIDYLSVMGTPLLAGRLFDASFGTDRAYVDNPGVIPALTPVVLTRTALPLVDALTPEEAIGRQARFVSPDGKSDVPIEVVGVIDDFYFRSLRFPPSPVIFLPNPAAAQSFVAHIDGDRREEAVAAIQAAVTDAQAAESIANQAWVQDLEAMAEDQYTEERRWRRLVTGAAVLAIGVACLGLYGLTAFSANQRRREVGVRKSLGADEAQVLRLMLARFARPVLAGVAIGWIAAWFAMAEWLQGFAKHTTLTPLPFALAGAAALAVAGATALFHAMRAARTSPAIVLRAE
jgi:putative ABC transport system permease protein